jgi:hypothetical protein
MKYSHKIIGIVIFIILLVLVLGIVYFCSRNNSTCPKDVYDNHAHIDDELVTALNDAYKTDPFTAGNIHRTYLITGDPAQDNILAARNYLLELQNLYTRDDFNYRLDIMRDFANNIADDIFTAGADIDDLDDDVQAILNADFDAIRRDVINTVSPAIPLENKIKWTADPQNVHDSTVNTTASNMYKYVSDSVKDLPPPIYADTIEHKMNDFNMDRNAIRTFNRIKDCNTYMTKFDASEMDILKAMWARSLLPQNKERKTDIQNAIIGSLSNCIEKGDVVCPVGRVSHIVDSLVSVDNDTNIQPILNTQTIRNFCFTQAAGIRDKMLADAPEYIRNAYNADEKTEDVENLSKSIKDAITEKLMQTKHSALSNNDMVNIISESISDI